MFITLQFWKSYLYVLNFEKGLLNLLIVFFRAIILYALVIFSIRLMGKRQIGELQPSELVITILVSNIATLPIEDTTIPMTTGIIPILTLVSLDVIMSALTLRSKKLRQIVSGSPKVIISNGEIDQAQMKKLRFSVDDLMESLHDYNIFDISEVQYAIVETTGKISVMQKNDYRSLTPSDIELYGESKNPPQILIDDGVVMRGAIKFLGLDMKFLNEILKKNKVDVSDVFLMSCDEDKNYKLIKKEDSQ